MSKERDPFTKPFANAEDLGLAIPDDDHAVSVCLPMWADVIGYEEGEDRVMDELECGYPRFVEHPVVAELFMAATEEFAKKNEVALVFPSLAAAWRCADFVKSEGGKSVRLESYGWYNLTVLLLPEPDYPIAWKGWQHAGEIVSSRMAEAALLDAPLSEQAETLGKEALDTLRQRIADLYPEHDVKAGDVYLFSSGMAAIAAAHRVVVEERKLPTAQIEFPYLDALKLQQKFNPAGVVDLSIVGEEGGYKVLKEHLETESVAAVFSEIPSNPLLRTGNLADISEILQEKNIPLVVDDTVATAWNADGFRFADVITTSLTKLFSGEGDVAAGAVILKLDSPHYKMFKERLADQEESSPLFCLDAITLEINSRHFGERVEATNENCADVLEYLDTHPKVDKIWHPTTIKGDYYHQVKRESGGYGGLFSMTLKDGANGAAERFYNALQISKGPSLGTNFSLVCPYTLLAHYDELDWAESCGLPRHLIRVWIGLEESDDLIDKFDQAFDAV